MSTPRERLEVLLKDEWELYALLCDAGFIPRDDNALVGEHLETARVARTLVRELNVNWAGVEVVLHMRSQLIEMRRQLSELAQIVRRVQDEQRDPR